MSGWEPWGCTFFCYSTLPRSQTPADAALWMLGYLFHGGSGTHPGGTPVPPSGRSSSRPWVDQYLLSTGAKLGHLALQDHLPGGSGGSSWVVSGLPGSPVSVSGCFANS